jgi:hypothetical protein
VSVTHPEATRMAIADFVVDRLDLNTPPAKLILQTAGGATVATLTFSNPAFGAAASGTCAATAAAITADTNAVGGTIAKAELRQGGGTPIILCSVTNTSSGGDIQMNNVIVSAGQQVSITAMTYTPPL